MTLFESLQSETEERVHELLLGSRLLFPVRSAYQRLFRRERWAHWQRMLDLYSPFIAKNSLVFDVGANFGLYSELFLELGARVVAIEPNHECHPRLERLASCERLFVEKAACGATPGEANLHVSDSSGICTLSQQWFDITSRSRLYADSHWVGSDRVQVTTLAALAARYGTPDFIKIDVEGFEKEVLSGMTFAPRALSFEIHTSMLDIAAQCLQRLGAGYVFNYVSGDSARMALSDWIDADSMGRLLRELPAEPDYGDIYARRRSALDLIPDHNSRGDL